MKNCREPWKAALALHMLAHNFEFRLLGCAWLIDVCGGHVPRDKSRVVEQCLVLLPECDAEGLSGRYRHRPNDHLANMLEQTCGVRPPRNKLVLSIPAPCCRASGHPLVRASTFPTGRWQAVWIDVRMEKMQPHGTSSKCKPWMVYFPPCGPSAFSRSQPFAGYDAARMLGTSNLPGRASADPIPLWGLWGTTTHRGDPIVIPAFVGGEKIAHGDVEYHALHKGANCKGQDPTSNPCSPRCRFRATCTYSMERSKSICACRSVNGAFDGPLASVDVVFGVTSGFSSRSTNCSAGQDSPWDPDLVIHSNDEHRGSYRSRHVDKPFYPGSQAFLQLESGRSSPHLGIYYMNNRGRAASKGGVCLVRANNHDRVGGIVNTCFPPRSQEMGCLRGCWCSRRWR